MLTLCQSMQDLNETRVDKLNSFWLLAAKIETDTLERELKLIDHLAREVPRNVPNLDSIMYARHNLSHANVPGDVMFEPSPVWHDDDALITDDAAQNFLRNILLKSKGSMMELRRDVDGKRREVDSTRNIRAAIRNGRDKRDEVEVVKSIFQLQELLHESSWPCGH